MTNYDFIKSMTMEQLAAFFNANTQYDGTPWQKWFDENYCQKCESETAYVSYLGKECECSYCELNGNCRYFKNMLEVPSCEEICKMWLLSLSDNSD